MNDDTRKLYEEQEYSNLWSRLEALGRKLPSPMLKLRDLRKLVKDLEDEK